MHKNVGTKLKPISVSLNRICPKMHLNKYHYLSTCGMRYVYQVSDKMVNGSPILMSAGKQQHSISFVYRFYHLSFYHLSMPDQRPSTIQLPTARKKWRPATADSSPHAVTCQHCDRHYFSRPRTHNLPIVGPSATSSAIDSPIYLTLFGWI